MTSQSNIKCTKYIIEMKRSNHASKVFFFLVATAVLPKNQIKFIKLLAYRMTFDNTVRTVNFVTLRKLNVRNQKINVAFQKINGTKPKMIVTIILLLLSCIFVKYMVITLGCVLPIRSEKAWSSYVGAGVGSIKFSCALSLCATKLHCCHLNYVEVSL
ncbi:hypothetical protein BDF21DRAFT_452096 [Thamnidium elegans]|nr:hypothetical protein BDF21DRAFT_452096 [Thamnidium elegans]